MSDANKAVARRLYEEVISTGNFDLLDELIAPNFVGHQPGGREARGPAGMREVVGMYLRAFPGIRVTVEDQVAEGETVVTRFTARGTHNGDLGGVAPTGNEVRVAGISIDRFEGGKCVEQWQSFDELAMMQQIGAIPAEVGAET